MIRESGNCGFSRRHLGSAKHGRAQHRSTRDNNEEIVPRQRLVWSRARSACKGGLPRLLLAILPSAKHQHGVEAEKSGEIRGRPEKAMPETALRPRALQHSGTGATPNRAAIMASMVRSMVSKKKKRFTEDGFDLDLTYITDKIIAMGFPSTGSEASYRNPVTEVQKLFNMRHRGHVSVFEGACDLRHTASRFGGCLARLQLSIPQCAQRLVAHHKSRICARTSCVIPSIQAFAIEIQPDTPFWSGKCSLSRKHAATDPCDPHIWGPAA